MVAAELCSTRDEAQQIIAKADKATNKLNGEYYVWTRSSFYP